MNDTFNFTRFGWLFRKTLFERPIQLIGVIVLTMVASLLIYAIAKIFMGYEAAQNLTFMVGLIGGGSILASFVFGYFSTYPSGTSFLTLPASQFEKWLSAVIITGVIFPALYLGFYRILDVAFVNAYHNSLDVKGPFYKELYDAVFIFPLDGFVAQKTYLAFVNFAGAMLVGSLYFNKLSFIKVALIICGLFIGGQLLNYAMAKSIFDNLDRSLPYYCVFIPVNGQFGKVLLPETASKAVDLASFFIVPAILWIVSFIRLREKEF
jgi:hypothetical protein